MSRRGPRCRYVVVVVDVSVVEVDVSVVDVSVLDVVVSVLVVEVSVVCVVDVLVVVDVVGVNGSSSSQFPAVSSMTAKAIPIKRLRCPISSPHSHCKAHTTYQPYDRSAPVARGSYSIACQTTPPSRIW
jgi:hypothetical protein